MRIILFFTFFLTMFVRSQLVYSQDTLTTTDTNETFKLDSDIVCSPERDTMYIVKGPTTDFIIVVWDLPAYKDDKPVFIYVSKARIKEMAKMPRYIYKKNY